MLQIAHQAKIVMAQALMLASLSGFFLENRKQSQRSYKEHQDE